MKNRNWFWGIFFILAAVSVIAIQTGSFVEIGIQSLLLGAFLLAIIIASLIRLNAFGVFFPLAFLYMIFWQPLNIVYVDYWMVLLAALLVSIGFSIIFGKHHKYRSGCNGSKKDWNRTSESIDDNNPNISIRFGSAGKYLHADNLQGGRFDVSFGELEIFFDEVQLSPEGTEIYVNCSLGSLILNVPKQWRIKENIHVTLGELTNKVRQTNPEENAPNLTISGNLKLGNIEIRYI